MPRFQDKALILRRYAFGESSLVVHALTREHGRVHLLAKGAYRGTSRFAWVLDLFDTLELTWQQAPGRELQTLTEGRVLARRRAVPDDLEVYRAGLGVLELCELAAREEQPDPDLFDLACTALDRLGRAASAATRSASADGARSSAQRAALELLAFDLRFLRCLGLEPALVSCAACGAPAPPDSTGRASFSAGAGGRLCARCAADARASGRSVGLLPAGVLEIASALLEGSSGTLSRLRLRPEQTSAVREFVQHFLEYHMETRPKSRRAAALRPSPRTVRRSR